MAIISPAMVAIELASTLTWDKYSNVAPSLRLYAGPVVLLWDTGPHMPQRAMHSNQLYFSSAHSGLDNTFDCICLDLIWECS